MLRFTHQTFTIVFIIFSVCGCATSSQFTRTGTFRAAARADDCDFSVYTVAPSKPYNEIGVMEFSSFDPMIYGPHGGVRSIAEVKELARKDVCSQGGNGLLLWQSNGMGHYKKATVIFVDE